MAFLSELQQWIENYEGEVEGGEYFQAAKILEGAGKQTVTDHKRKRCPFSVCDMAVDIILSGARDMDEVMPFCISYYNQGKRLKESYTMDDWEDTKHERVGTGYLSAVLDNNEEHETVLKMKERNHYNRKTYIDKRSVLAMTKSLIKDLSHLQKELEQEMECEQLKDKTLNLNLSHINFLKTEGYINESERKKFSVQACKERGWTQKHTAEKMEWGLATVKRYWNI